VIKRRGVCCPSADVGKNYPLSKDRAAMWFVPYSVCSKCRHYRKAKKGMPYPHCAHARQQRGGAAGAAEALTGILSRAMTLGGG
jgi:hypothetical protein